MKTLHVAAAIAIGLAPAVAAANDDLLSFDWLSEDRMAEVESAHEALAEAEAAMCALMVGIYAEHASRVHGGDALSDEETAFFRRRCEATAEADHIAQSLSIHDRIHAESHAGGDGHGHSD